LRLEAELELWIIDASKPEQGEQVKSADRIFIYMHKYACVCESEGAFSCICHVSSDSKGNLGAVCSFGCAVLTGLLLI